MRVRIHALGVVVALLFAAVAPPPPVVTAAAQTPPLQARSSAASRNPDPVSHLASHGAARPTADRAASLGWKSRGERPTPTRPATAAPQRSGSVSPATISSYQLSGHVVDSAGRPVPAHLTLWPLAACGAVTDMDAAAADGAFSALVEGCSYLVSVGGGWWGPSGFQYLGGAVDPFVVSSDVSVTIALPDPVMLSGRVTAGGVALSGVEVDIFHENAKYTVAYSQPDGTWSAGVMPGAYEVGFYSSSTAHGSGWLGTSGYTPDPGAARVVSVARSLDVGSVALPATHTVTGTVYRPAGTGKAGVTVEAWVDDAFYGQATTGSTGSYTLKLPSGSLTLWAFDPSAELAPGWRTSTGVTANPASAAVSSVSANVSGLSFHLPTASHISGSTFWMLGVSRGIESGIWVEADAFGTAASAAVTDDNGNFTMPVLPGSYLLWADGHRVYDNVAGGYYVSGDVTTADYALGTPVPVATGGTARVQIQLVPGVTVSADIHTVNGFYTPLADIDVELFVNGHFYRDGVSTGAWQQNAQIPGVAAGTYRVALVDLAGDYVGGWWANTSALVPDASSAVDVPVTTGGPVAWVMMATPGAPDAPSGVAVTPFHASATVAWQPVASTANFPIFAYTATASPGGAQCIAYATTSCTIVGLSDGTAYSIAVTAASPAGTSSPSSPVGVTPLPVPDAPTGVAGAPSGSSAVVTWSAPPDNGSPITGYTVTSTPGGLGCSTAGTIGCTVSGLADGVYTFRVSASNANGPGPISAASPQMRIDTTRPTVTAPTATAAVGSWIGSTVPVVLTWSGADTGSGIANYQVWMSVNGGTYVQVASPTSATYTRALAPSASTYRFEVRAVDKAGNVSGFMLGPAFHVRLVQQTSTAVHWYGTWYTVTSSWASGGSYRYTWTAGRYLYSTFSGRSVAVVATKGTGFGSFRVYLDGVYVGTVSDYATSTQYRRIVYAKTWAASGTHTIKIVVSGTAGHPRVDLDALVVLG